MRKQIQGYITGVLTTALFVGGVAYAKSGQENITANYDNYKVYIDNTLADLKDANGTTVEPFVYNGTTYLPVRGVAQAMGAQVTYDGLSKSIYIWDKMVPGETYLMDVCPPYDGSHISTKDFKMGGKTYTGFCLFNGGGYALVNLDGKYSSLIMEFGGVDGMGQFESTINIYLDGKKVNTYELNSTDLPRAVTIPLNGALQMKIEAKNSLFSTAVGFGNITLN